MATVLLYLAYVPVIVAALAVALAAGQGWRR